MTDTLSLKKIENVLISVYDKEHILEIANKLITNGSTIISTGGTFDYLQDNNIPVKTVESITGYPSIFGGRVKTLHPKILGGILFRRDMEGDVKESEAYEIPNIDLVIVDLYPFEEYLKANAPEVEIIEKIDIGGISLIRAAAKNYKDVLIVASKNEYKELITLLDEKKGSTSLEDRRYFAAQAFKTSSHYDSMIFSYFDRDYSIPHFSKSVQESTPLRYGENPHQKAFYFGEKTSIPEQLWGKEISYNNLLDIEAALELISDFKDTALAIIKHNNACGCAARPNMVDAWNEALSSDPISAFGGVIVANGNIDLATAEEMNKIFFEVVIATGYDEEALEILKSKKNRIILKYKPEMMNNTTKFRSMMGGVLVQDKDSVVEKESELQYATTQKPSSEEVEDLLFANILVKHSKSNAIVLAKGKKLLSSGIGQTSRVDALRQAIEKAANFNQSLEGAVMASDAFFPFPDCVEIAGNAGISSVIQPGGSIKDGDSIKYCEENNISMVITGKRHFKH